MNVRRLLIAPIFISLLASCSNQNSLRSDIRDFIASFSLEDAVIAYKEAGYIETKIATESSKVTKTIEELSFNVKDALHPAYKKTTSTFLDEILEEKIIEEIKEENGEFFFCKTGQEDVPYSLEESHKLVEQFFYKSVEYETIHLYGMYYGDYIKQIVTTLQSLVTIDEEKELYIYEASRSYLNDKNIKVNESQKYEIDKLGMLVSNHLVRYTDTLTVTTDIEVYHV